MSTPTDRRALLAWRTAAATMYVATGIAFSSWVTRTPQIRDSLHLSTAQMGFVLFGMSAGAMVGLLLSGPLVARFGGRPILTIGASMTTAGTALIGAGTGTGIIGVTVIGLAFTGAGFGVGEVALNIEGATLERIMGRSVLPTLHGAFSIGSLAGAALGTIAEQVQVPVTLHLVVVGLVLIPVCLFASRFIPSGSGREERATEPGDRMRALRDRLSVWAEPRTLLIGVTVFCMALAEGTANDWLPIAMVSGHHTDAVVAALSYGVFVAAMTIGRLSGGRIVDRFGRVRALRVAATLASVGLVMVVFVPNLALILIGVLLWGLGVALGFPLGLSAAADDPNHTSARVSAVATIGYFAFLVGPPTLGLLGQDFGILNAFLVIVVATIAAGLVASAARPPATAAAARAEPTSARPPSA